MIESQIKLFLSVDIVGSTKLKNTNNYFQIQKFCKEHLKLEHSINKNSKSTPKEIYEKICEDESHQDWSQIINKCFDDFNASFISNLEPKEIFPWKMAGDELIYCIDVKNRKEVHDNLLAFFKTLRFFDKQYFKKGSYIRLQGSAWTAGFPIRNRIMTPITSASEKCKNTEDYMGPEIDIGFRIGKYTFAGIIVLSLELAYILLDAKLTLQTTERIRVIDTGWEVLKGVWEGKRYPIFWLDLPEQYDTNGKEINYTPYTQWDIEENKHVKNYAAAKENSKYERDSDLRSIIQSLPKSFDVNIPYFITDEDEFPPEHQERLEFINIVNEVTQTNKEQNKSKKKSKNMNSIDKIMDLVDGALTKNRHPSN